MSKFRLVIFSSASPNSLDHFLRRLDTDLPEVQVAGILYENRSSRLSRGKRIKRAFRMAGESDFRAFVGHRLRRKISSALELSFDSILRVLHAAPRNPNGPPVSLDTIISHCNARQIRFHLTGDMHDSASLEFVRNLVPDLGVIYGTRILKPELFSIPTNGSINIHKHKLPDYRGGGAPGIWELRDDRSEASVSVHRVLKEVDAGPILGEISFPIEQFDTLESVGLKADLLAIDLLIDVLRKESLGQTVEVPQPGLGSLYKGFQPHQIFAIERQIKTKRSGFKPSYGRPLHKLLIRTLMYPAVFLRNLRRRRQKQFPVVILFHHLITDRQKFMGLSTAQFASHVRFLKKHYRVVSLSEAISQLRKGEVAVPTVALTFDDGYAENFLCLRAVAERQQVPISLFVCTENVTGGIPFQHDVEKNERDFGPLTWTQLRYLSDHGVIIGSHTRTHFDCGSTDEKKLTDEIIGSKDDLLRELGGQTVNYFAFPKGHPRNMSEQAMHIAGTTYDFFFSACGGTNHSLATGSRELFRCGHPDSLWELELLMQELLEFRKVGANIAGQSQRIAEPELFASGPNFASSSGETNLTRH